MLGGIIVVHVFAQKTERENQEHEEIISSLLLSTTSGLGGCGIECTFKMPPASANVDGPPLAVNDKQMATKNPRVTRPRKSDKHQS